MERIPATCAAIRRARTAALDLAAEADMDGRHGIARALRRKAHAPRPGDWFIKHTAREVIVTISAHGVGAYGRRHTTQPIPDADTALAVNDHARRIVAREQVPA